MKDPNSVSEAGAFRVTSNATLASPVDATFSPHFAIKNKWRYCGQLDAINHALRNKCHSPIETEYRGLKRIVHCRLRADDSWREVGFPKSAKCLRGELTTGGAATAPERTTHGQEAVSSG